MVQERSRRSAAANDRGSRAGAICGVLAGLLWIVGQMAYDAAPELGAAGAPQIIQFYADEAASHRLGVTVAGFVFILFCIYLSRLSSLPARAADDGGSAPTALLTGGIIVGVMYLLAATIATIPLSRNLPALNAGTVESLFSLRALGQQLVFSMAPRVVFLAAAGLTTLRSGVLPRWLGMVALGFAGVAFAGGLRFLFPVATPAYGITDGLAILSNFTLPLWIVASSIAMLGRRPALATSSAVDDAVRTG